MADLATRCHFFRNWVENGKPRIFDISLFFFTQGFLTSILQNYARKYTVAIDTIEFRFSLTDMVLDDEGYVAGGNAVAPQLLTGLRGAHHDLFDDLGDTTYISGLFMEAARLDGQTLLLCEARLRELYFKMPVIKFTPCARATAADDEGYECPCYRTTARFGTLSTTGHSTNFLLMVRLPCHPSEARHWVKRSVAMFASLSD